MSLLKVVIGDFKQFTAQLIGLPVSHVWQGSAIFLEFGNLSEGRKRRGGSLGNPNGAWTLMIEWSWRVEGKRLIWCGSWSDKEGWPKILGYLQGATVSDVQLFGRIPEMHIELSNGLHLLSFMTAGGDPEWSLRKPTADGSVWLSVKSGRLTLENSSRH